MATTYTDKERDLQWKFRYESTTELEYKLMSANWMTKAEQSDIEFELVRRGSTYVRRSYYDRPSKFFGSDGSSLSIATAGQETGRTICDWDNIIAAEAAYIDRIMAKPVVGATATHMGSFLKEQTAMIRRIVPGLIAMDIAGVQPMAEPNIMPWFKNRSEAFSKLEVDAIIAADKDLQPMKSQYFWPNKQEIGRGLREPKMHFGDIHVVDYMSLMHTKEMPKTNIGLTALMESLKNSEATHASFFDTENTGPIYSHWIKEHKTVTEDNTSKWLSEWADAVATTFDNTAKKPLVIDRDIEFMYQHDVSKLSMLDIMNDDVRHTYPSGWFDAILNEPKKCCEVLSSLPAISGDMTLLSAKTEVGKSKFADIWEDWAKMMSRPLKTTYYKNSKMILATAPVAPADYGILDCAPGIEPERKPFIQDLFHGESASYDRTVDNIISIVPQPKVKNTKSVLSGIFDDDDRPASKADIALERSILDDDAEEQLTFTMSKKRPQGESQTFNLRYDFSKWAAECKPEEDTATSTLALLGIGDAL